MSHSNDPHFNENDDQPLEFSEFGSESAEDFPDLDFSSFEMEESAESVLSDATDEVSDFSDFGDFADQDILVGETPLVESLEMESLEADDFGSAAPVVPQPEPETGKKGKKAKKEKPPKAKKEKPPKVKKEKPPKKPRDPNAPGLRLEEMLALGACALLTVVFLILNVFSLGNMMFLILMNIIAVVVIVVPFLLFKFGRESSLSLFDVSLGLAVIALSIGALLLLSVWKDYDFTIKPNASLNVKPIVAMHKA